MPIYEYECPACGITERLGEIKETQPEEIPCEACGGPATKIFPTQVTLQLFQPYFDQHIQFGGAQINSREQQRALLKKNGLKEVGNDSPHVHKNWDKPATLFSIPGTQPGPSRVTARSAKPFKNV